jgi:PTH1 family peptidyl-tRNA hydrolase
VEERTPQIRLIAGLGNPGPEYAATRHNIGFMVVEQLVAQFGSTWEESPKWDALSAKCGAVLVVKPMSFMNRSGHPLFAIAQFYKIAAAEIIVVLDDLALPLGRLRLRAGGGSAGHNGLESIIIQFGTEEIPRLRIGIGEAPRDGSVDYVLSRFFEEEKPIVRSTIDRAAEAVKCTIDNGLISAMNSFNKAEES